MFGVGHPHIKPESLKIVAIGAIPAVNREAARGLRHGDAEEPAATDVRVCPAEGCAMAPILATMYLTETEIYGMLQS